MLTLILCFNKALAPFLMVGFAIALPTLRLLKKVRDEGKIIPLSDFKIV
jgi:hypothetical protein